MSDALRSVRLTGAMLFLVNTTDPWITWAPNAEAFRRVVLPASQHVVSYHVVTRGRCCAGLVGGHAEEYAAGDMLVVPHGDAYFLADSPGTQVSYGHDEAVSFLGEMAAGKLPPLVTEGGGGPQRTQFICGFLGCHVRPFNPVLAALPRMIHLRAQCGSADRMRPMVEFAVQELHAQRSGSSAVLLRLAELMFVELVRRHIESSGDDSAGWIAALRDPLVARALAALHNEPERRWTLDALAERCNASRSRLAERFTQLVGMPPMRYLTRWRMQLATHELDEIPARKLSAVAERAGYESESAFSRAFKKCTGLAPGRWRQRVES